MLSFTVGQTSISIFIDGLFFSVDDSHANYPLLKDELRKPSAERDLEAIRGLVSIKRMIERMTVGRVSITDTAVLFEGTQIGSYLAERMIELMDDGIDIEPYAAFMNNVFDNPAKYTRDELYQWMEKGRLPITPDGCFLAFKKVRANYTDCHTGKFDNSPGTILEMDRAACDTVRTNHCSTGFHFCSPSYLSSFPGQRVVVVKINPRDVTSIPNDYNFAKGRCCRYEVVAELTEQSQAFHEAWRTGVVNLENPAEFPIEMLSQIVIPSPALNEPARVIIADSDPAYTSGDRIFIIADRHSTGCLATVSYVDQNGDVWAFVDGATIKNRFMKENIREATAEEIRAAQTSAYATVIASPDNSIEAQTRAAVEVEVEAACVKLEAETTDAPVQKVVKADVLMAQATGEQVFSTSDGREFSVTMLQQALKDASIRGAARNLGIGDSTLRGWMKKAGITA